jgi:hypothetical protein
LLAIVRAKLWRWFLLVLCISTKVLHISSWAIDMENILIICDGDVINLLNFLYKLKLAALFEIFLVESWNFFQSGTSSFLRCGLLNLNWLDLETCILGTSWSIS